MKRIGPNTPLVYALLLRLLLLLSLTPFGASAAEVRESNSFFSLNTGDLKAELTDARSESRKALLIMFEQEGCPGCAYMRRNVLSRKEVRDYFHRNFVNLSLDIYGSVTLKDFSGRESTEKGYSQAVKVRATPTFVFYDLTGAEVARYVGPFETPEEFMLFGDYVSSGAYKTRTFAQFKLQKSRGS